MPNAIDVARYILATQGGVPGERITNLKLQKLLYYSQGFYVALHGRPLFPERIRPWTHGPVVYEVWKAYREHGSAPLPVPAHAPRLEPDERELVDDVAQTYGQYSAWRLREMTHSERPWLEAFDSSSDISLTTMETFFKGRLQT